MGRDDAKRVLLFDSYQAAQSLEKCRKPWNLSSHDHNLLRMRVEI